MRIVIAGGHGKVAMLLHPILIGRGHRVSGLIRNPAQAADLENVGAAPVVCDLEREEGISEAVGAADAVIFAAGAGPGSGAERKLTMDRDGAIKLIRAAQANGIRRYLMISTFHADDPFGNEVFRTYMRAKAAADRALRESGLDYIIIRPGRLTDGPETGRIALAPRLSRGEIPRADVAALLAELLEREDAVGRQWEATAGDMLIADAIASAIAAETS